MVFRQSVAQALLILAVLAVPFAAAAGEFRSRPHDRHRFPDHHRQSVVGGAGLPTVLPGIGTYAGSISAVSIRGNGIYFAVDRNSASRPTVILAPKALIIEVDFSGDGPACQYEAGVCVIRP